MHVVSKAYTVKRFPTQIWEISWTPWKLRAFSTHSLYILVVTRTLHSTVTGVRLAVPGARLTVHVVASRSTVHGPAIRVVPGAPCRGCQAQTHPPRYQVYRPRCQACYTYPVCQTHHQRVPGLPSLVLGLPYPVVSYAPSRVPRLAVHGTRFTVHVVASRRTVPGLGYESTIQPAPCPLCQPSSPLHSVQTGCASPRAGCIPESDAQNL